MRYHNHWPPTWNLVDTISTSNTTTPLNLFSLLPESLVSPLSPLPFLLKTISSLYTLLLSYPFILNGISLFIFSALAKQFAHLSHRATTGLWAWVERELFIVAEMTEPAESYDWMLNYWVHHKSWIKAARHFECETEPILNPTRATRLSRRETLDPAPTKSTFHPQFIPERGVPHTIWFQGHYVKLVRERVGRGPNMNRITVSILSRTHAPFLSLLQAAKTAYEQQDATNLVIRTLDPTAYTGMWRKTLAISRRGLESIVAEPGAMEAVVKDMREFLGSKGWYRRRGVPWRRGWLFYGKPGTGKTSSIHALASELDMEIYILSLAASGLNDSNLMKAMMSAPAGVMVVIEDVDAVLPTRQSQVVAVSQASRGSDENGDNAKPKIGSQVTLSGVLNALDGLASGEGRILIMTTNHKESLDPALIRPGRADVHIEYKLASLSQAKQLFRLFYPTSVTAEPGNAEVELGSEEKVDERIWEEEEVEKWVEEWGGKVPERVFSVAQLQSILLRYKSDPAGAVEYVGEWVGRELKRKAEREAKRQARKAVAVGVVTAPDEEQKDEPAVITVDGQA